MSRFVNLHKEVDDRTFTTDRLNLLAVTKAVKGVTEWGALVLVLGIDNADYIRIKKESSNLNLDLVDKWLQLGQASWSALVEALCDELVEQFDIAQKIAADHPRQPSGNNTTEGAARGAGTGGIDDNPISKKSPEPYDAFNQLRSRSADWEAVARDLGVPGNKILIETKKGLSASEDTKLDNILNYWRSSYCSPVTWGHLYDVVLNRLSWKPEAEKIKEYVCSAEAKSKYSGKSDWKPN